MKRLLTALALIAVAIYLIFLAPDPVFMAAALCMGFLCYHEFSGLVARYSIQKPGIFGILAGLVMLFEPQHTLIGIVLLLVIALALSLRRDDLRGILPQVACAFFGAFYTFAPWRFAADLRGFRREGVHLLFFALALNWIGDTAAYYVGRRLGRHKLAPVVSPKKSWEGAIASVAASVTFGLLYLGKLMPQIPWWDVTTMAVCGNIAGQFGDLAESAIKRGAGVKDSGNMLPGHGGMLDRVDSSLFALPVIYGIYIVSLRAFH
jgi:phosphatidate cytidylyltransferase